MQGTESERKGNMKKKKKNTFHSELYKYKNIRTIIILVVKREKKKKTDGGERKKNSGPLK